MSTHVEWISAKANMAMLRGGDPYLGSRDEYGPEDLTDDNSVQGDNHAISLSENEVIVIEGTLDELEVLAKRILGAVGLVRLEGCQHRNLTGAVGEPTARCDDCGAEVPVTPRNSTTGGT